MSGAIRKKMRAALSIIADMIKMSRKAEDFSSLVRYSADMLLVRLRKDAREREIRLRPGVRLRYRLNRGDIQSIREVWLDELYKLPVNARAEVLVDLGANIGLTSLWLAKTYGFKTVIAVEPMAANARLVKANLDANGVSAQVIEAAVGPMDGTALFEDSDASNLGRISTTGRPVTIVSMFTILSSLAESVTIDVLKLDIEGGEEPLLRGDLAWLGRVQSVIAEFHPDIIDYTKAIQSITDMGFRYIKAGSAHRNSMDFFLRN